jgi:hypothetical protein
MLVVPKIFVDRKNKVASQQHFYQEIPHARVAHKISGHAGTAGSQECKASGASLHGTENPRVKVPETS